MNFKEKIEYLKKQAKKYETCEEPQDGEELVNYGICEGLQKAIRILETDIDGEDYNKQYTLKVIQSNDGELSFNATNEGFNAFELLGFLDMKKNDVMLQVQGDMEPNIEYKRKVIKEE